VSTTEVEAIVIGASAGGVEALGRLLAAPRAGFRPATLLVLHVPSGAPSRLAQVLGARCALPVQEALDKQPIERGRVYVAPPDYHLQVEPDRTLSLSVDGPVNFSRPSIDVLFDSAARVYCERLLGIVLTGASEDGAAGLTTLLACGGEAWVQDPAEAEVPRMPQAALAVAGPAARATLAEMCRRLADCSRFGETSA
jgi:two-component system chemotaxis response regulator CheB